MHEYFPRYVPIEATSNSGKMLYCCLRCGKVGPYPDKKCCGYIIDKAGEKRHCHEEVLAPKYCWDGP